MTADTRCLGLSYFLKTFVAITTAIWDGRLDSIGVFGAALEADSGLLLSWLDLC